MPKPRKERKLVIVQGDVEMVRLAKKFSAILAREKGAPRLSAGSTVVLALREALKRRKIA